MTRPPCVRLCPAYPGNPRTRIEGESPPLCKGTYGLRSIREADASRRMAAKHGPGAILRDARARARAPQDEVGDKFTASTDPVLWKRRSSRQSKSSEPSG